MGIYLSIKKVKKGIDYLFIDDIKLSKLYSLITFLNVMRLLP